MRATSNSAPSAWQPDPAYFADDGSAVIRARDTELCLWETLDPLPPSSPHRIYLFKDRRFLSALTAILDRIVPKSMVEIGILHGGSTIYWAERYQLERLSAFEFAPAAPMLARYLARHGLTGKVRVHHGVSQDDAPALRAALGADFAGEPVDAVVDDASHGFLQTRATVETLLPYVRPGGAYVIEDWAWGHAKNWPPALWSDRPLMSPLLCELMLICGHNKGVIDRIEIDPNFAVLWRGAAPLPSDGSFRLADHYVPRDFPLPTLNRHRPVTASISRNSRSV